MIAGAAEVAKPPVRAARHLVRSRSGTPDGDHDGSGRRDGRHLNLYADLLDEIQLRGLGPHAPQGINVSSVQHLGSLIRRQRRRLGLTQAEVAVAAGVGRRLVVELEGGKETVHAAEMLRVCAAVHLIVQAASRTIIPARAAPLDATSARPPTADNGASTQVCDPT